MDGKDENAHHPNTSEACCREHFDTLNVIITSIKDQFNRKAYFAFLKLEQFLLLYTSLAKVIMIANQNFFTTYTKMMKTPQIKTEAFSISTVFKETLCTILLDVYIHKVISLNKLKLIPNIFTIVQLILTNPAAFCTRERSFLASLRLNTWL